MLREAVNWRATSTQRSLDEVLTDPMFAKYVEGWGRRGDIAIIATLGHERVGATWYRFFDPAHAGYGYVSPTIPELTLAVARAYRARGIGSAILAVLIETARTQAVSQLSLSVEPDNHAAVQLYERHGFVRVGERDGAWTMIRDVAQHTSECRDSTR
jgi:ribosomal protein S18 acetylase RimI-like enzyme